MAKKTNEKKAKDDEAKIILFKSWQNDWNKFVREVLKARLDKEQQDIISSVQHNPMTTVASGTARGKDFVAACACLCFFYLTPKWNEDGNLIENTKVAMTAPTGRQVTNIMVPEVRRLLRNAGCLPGRVVAGDIRTDYEEWFLTGFKADDNNAEAWSGFHAVNTMFAVTEATGISELTYSAIEGNLQGNSRLLLVFNPNITTGYAAKSMKSARFKKFRLNSLHAENVVNKKVTITGQVDYNWIKDKVESWCSPISESELNEGEGDFHFEKKVYRPNDLFRVKVLGMFPRISEDNLIPYEWIALANERWQLYKDTGSFPNVPVRIGVDVAGMGRDESVLCHRFDNYVDRFDSHQSAGKADHMHVAGMLVAPLGKKGTYAFIDTIGEGAGVFSRLIELGLFNAVSCKFSEGANDMNDITGVYTFANMRAYLYWCVRDWLDPKNKFLPCLPPCDKLTEEATEIKWKFQSNGSIIIEPKEDIKKRIKRSTDYFDPLANTFYPTGLGLQMSDDDLLADLL
jgi:hypothetical protein